MGPSFLRKLLLTSAVVAALYPALLPAQTAPPLAGTWTLNRSLSEFPRDIGFNPAWAAAATADSQAAGQTAGGGGGRRGSGGGAGNRGTANPFSARPESSEDAKRAQVLTAEVRTPPARLTIVDTPASVTITNELGQSRTLHPSGLEELLDLQGALIGVTSKREGDRLVVTYRADQDRELRYTYSYSSNSAQLVVDVQFLDHGAGDKARRVYEPGSATPPALSTQSGQAGPEAFDQRPGAELRGLRSLGVLVEDLSAQAVACGVNHDAIETALSKRLTDGGFIVRRNSDDDTYVYVNVMTSSSPNGLCVSRYDAFLYTHATAKLSFRDQAVLVQVSLMHRGGIGSSAPADHGAAIARGLQDYVDLFIAQIREANK